MGDRLAFQAGDRVYFVGGDGTADNARSGDMSRYPSARRICDMKRGVEMVANELRGILLTHNNNDEDYAIGNLIPIFAISLPASGNRSCA
jgi:hypothetical protein